MKRLPAHICACALAIALGLCPTSALAAGTGPQPGPLPDSPTHASQPQESTDATDASNAPDAAEAPADTNAETAPEAKADATDPTQAVRFSLTNIGQATTAKIQKPWGSCWAFAVAGAIESSILKAEAASSGAPSTTLSPDSPAYAEAALDDLPTAPDISERAIGWFAHEPQTEASGGAQAGEGLYRPTPSPEDQLSGGNFATAASALTAWQSLLTEEAAPYEYNGYAPGASAPWYATDADVDTRYEDWSLADDLRTKEDTGWRVSEVLRLQSPAKLTEERAYAGYDEAAAAAVKRTLVDVGGVAIALSMEQNIPSQVWKGDYATTPPSESFTFSTWSQYDASATVSQDHAAVILGWDDAYPASSFQGTASGQPPADGAWLCKNSWGNDALFEDMGGADEATHWGLPDAQGRASGYFWLSYYDHTISDLEAFAVTPITESYDSIYQHDYLGATEYVAPVQYDGPVQTANAFTAKETELIEAVTAWTFAPGTGCAATVRVLPVGFDAAHASADEVMAAAPPLARAQADFPEAGFHTLELDAPVLVMQGQTFVITLEIAAEPGGFANGELADDAPSYLGLEVAYLDRGSPEQATLATAVANPGETLISLDGATWMRLEDFNAHRTAVREQFEKESDLAYGNAIVKGLANATTMAEPGHVYQVVPLS